MSAAASERLALCAAARASAGGALGAGADRPVRARAARRHAGDRARRGGRALGADPQTARHRRLAERDRDASRLPHLPDRAARLHRRLRGAAGARGADLKALGDRARGGAAADRVRRPGSDLDRCVQLHRLRAHGRRARDQPLHARPDRDRPRPGLPIRRQRLEARRHCLRPAVHVALLPAGAARREGRAVGDETRGAARRCRHARAHLALRARAGPGPGARAARGRREPAVGDLRPRGRAQRPDHDAVHDGRGQLLARRTRRLGRCLGGGGRAREGDRRGAACRS